MKILKNLSYIILISFVSTNIYASSFKVMETSISQVADEIEESEDIDLFNWVQEIEENYQIIEDLKMIANTVASSNSVKETEDSMWKFLNASYRSDILNKMDDPKIFGEKQKEQAEKSIIKMVELVEDGKLVELLSLLSRSGFEVKEYNEERQEYQVVTVPKDISEDQLSFLNNERLNKYLISFIKKIDGKQFGEEYSSRLLEIRENLSKVSVLIDNNQFVKAYRETESLYFNFGYFDTRIEISDILKGDFGYERRAVSAWKKDILLFLDTASKKYKPEINKLLNIFLQQ